jgi:hypothetical protein
MLDSCFICVGHVSLKKVMEKLTPSSHPIPNRMMLLGLAQSAVFLLLHYMQVLKDVIYMSFLHFVDVIVVPNNIFLFGAKCKSVLFFLQACDHPIFLLLLRR